MFSMASLGKKEFSWKSSLSLCLASQLSYESSHTITQTAITSWGFSQCDFFDKCQTQGFVVQNNDFALIAFRGTENVLDWLGNLNILRTERPYGKVHKGFFDGYSVVHELLKSLLPLTGGQKKKVWITGHSLGGALATIAAVELKDSIDIQGIFTYGQPRVGNDDFQEHVFEHFTDNFFRFVNDDDLVADLPPGFDHCKKLMHLGEDGSIISSLRGFQPRSLGENGSIIENLRNVQPSFIERPALSHAEFEALKKKIREIQQLQKGLPNISHIGRSDVLTTRGTGRVFGNLSFGGFIPGVKDHELENYIDKIKKNLSQ